MRKLNNSVQLIGNLGQDPEVKEINGGRKLAKFSLATNSAYKNGSGEKVEETQWHNLVAWGKTAELVEKYLQKGKKIAVEGKLNNRSYEDKEGNKRYFTEIIVNELLMLSKEK